MTPRAPPRPAALPALTPSLPGGDTPPMILTIGDSLRRRCAALFVALAGCGNSSPPTNNGVDAAALDRPAVTDAADVTDAPADAPPPPPSLGMNDVSVLFPLPSSLSAPGYLRATDQGAHGVLLPRKVFDLIPTFPVVPTEGLVYDRLRVLSLRFDGCGGPRDNCHPQIRVVLQPLRDDGLARDSALHVFYRLDTAAMGDVVSALRGMRALAPGLTDGPLDVNPALAAQGVMGPWGAALRELLLRHLGEQRMTRMTFFLRAPPVQEVWFFGGVERTDGAFVVMDIVGVGRGNQRVIRTDEAQGYRYDLTPVGATPEDHGAVLSAAASARASVEARNAALASLHRVGNPDRYVPDDLPCAGCHLATYVLAEAERTHGITAEGFAADRYTSRHDLSLRGGATDVSSSLRAFGWFNADAMIAQRTVNESAAVIDDLDRRYPAR